MGPMEYNKKLRNNPCGQMIFNKDTNIIQWEEDNLNKWFWETGYLHAKKCSSIFYITPYVKVKTESKTAGGIAQ
jgi:hypothetical protein